MKAMCSPMSLRSTPHASLRDSVAFSSAACFSFCSSMPLCTSVTLRVSPSMSASSSLRSRVRTRPSTTALASWMMSILSLVFLSSSATFWFCSLNPSFMSSAFLAACFSTRSSRGAWSSTAKRTSSSPSFSSLILPAVSLMLCVTLLSSLRCDWSRVSRSFLTCTRFSLMLLTLVPSLCTCSLVSAILLLCSSLFSTMALLISSNLPL
mmetsp:Transcript_29215/g.72138  ORF Transcript_29215/g.72138 Transcript_29215/m.72138 type:complete len:208 (-) Transcript_29215:139-762(-)